MPTNSELRNEAFKKTVEKRDFFLNRFNKNIGTRSKDMYRVVLQAIEKLDKDDDGNILTSSTNLKKLRDLRDKIKKTIITPKYKKDVKRFLGGFKELKGINDTYYKAIASRFTTANKQVYNAVTSLSIDATANSLSEAGINNAIISPVEKMLNESVTGGGHFVDLQEGLRTQILGDPSRLGSLERYSKQITTDALNQFNANYNKTVSQDLGLQFYYYNGGIKDTSRKYCIDRVNDGRYFHKNEVEDTANEEWAGKIPETNSSSIFINRGGYNCGHQWLAVDVIAVPSDVVQRNIDNGNYKP